MFHDIGSLIITLIISVLAGFIASAVMGQSRNSLLTNLLLGFGGSIVANIIGGGILGIYWGGGFLSGLIFATLGAILVIWLWQTFIKTNAAAGRRF